VLYEVDHAAGKFQQGAVECDAVQIHGITLVETEGAG
jgi:hypothetical protein